jgi:hypothetical protein
VLGVSAKRLSRQPRDGRIVLEKAQDKKKHINLEGGHGNAKSYNTFSVLSNSEIVHVVGVVKVEIGSDRFEKSSSLAKIQEVDLRCLMKIVVFVSQVW